MTPDERLEAAARAWLEHCDSVFPTSLPGRWEDVAAMLRNAYLGRAKTALAAAYPELTAGTHWLAPREMTREMAADSLAAMVRDIADRVGPPPPDTPENAFKRGLIIGACSRTTYELRAAWSAARDAYLREGGK